MAYNKSDLVSKIAQKSNLTKAQAEAAVNAFQDVFVEAMKSAGYDESLLYERKLITLTQMEKDFGKKAVAETLGELIVKPQGKPTLAPAKDKRPEFKPEEQFLAEFDK